MSTTSVVDLLFGDSGKGATIDYLASRCRRPLGVKVAGGAQALHHVQIGDVRFPFQQLSAAAARGADTIIGREFVIDPPALVREMDGFEKVFGFRPRVTVAEGCPVVLPEHVATAREIERKVRHGSTGRGVGAARLAGITVRRLIGTPVIEEMLDAGVRFGNIARELLGDYSDILLESSQGVMLDEAFGWFPHCVRSDVTHGPAERFCEEYFLEEPEKVGCIRTYTTRHGAGPLRGEWDPGHPLTVDEGNHGNEWTGSFRAGRFDPQMINWSLSLVDCEWLSVSCLDRYEPDEMVSGGFPRPDFAAGGLTLEERAGITGLFSAAPWDLEPLAPGAWRKLLDRPIGIIGSGPSAADRRLVLED